MSKNYGARQIVGWIVLIAIALIPAFLWYFLGDGNTQLVDYASITHSLGELFGLVGMTLFSLTFVLSTRINDIEDIFGGLDKVYIVHGILGGSALILLLFHPIFLVLKFIPSNVQLAAAYLLPSSYWSVNFGIIALMGLLILVYITLYTKMKYNNWKYTHEFLGLIFIFAVFHIFMVRGTVSQDNIFPGYYVYAAIVSAIGLFAFSYSLFLKNRLKKNATYTIASIKKTRDVFALELTPEHKPLEYESGQFIFIRFYNKQLSTEAHPFSIASASNAQTIKVVIKKLGDFTSELETLHVGDRVSIEGPYGRFHYKNYPHHEQVWIAAGIGITPFIGMAEDLEKHTEAKAILFHSANDKSEFFGKDIFGNIKSKNFTYTPWNSKEKGRISVESIKERLGDIKGKEFLICGSQGFKNNILQQLNEEGIKNKNIHEEAFDFR